MEKGIQQMMLGTVTNTEEEARKTLQRILLSGYDGLELNRFMIHPSGMMVRMMTQAAGMPTGNGGKLDWHSLILGSGLSVLSLHTDLGTLESEPEVIVGEAKSFGTDRVVITGMYRYDYTQKASVKALAKRLTIAGKALKKEGLRLFYHNHNVELLPVDKDERAYDVLIDETDEEYVNFEFDSYWFTEAGADAKQWMQRLGSRMKLWHITDRGSRQEGPALTPILNTDCVELGSGNMDLAGMKTLAEKANAEAVILESHKNWIEKDPLKSMEVSARWLKENIS